MTKETLSFKYRVHIGRGYYEPLPFPLPTKIYSTLYNLPVFMLRYPFTQAR